MPVYVVADRVEVAAIWPLVLIATVGVVAGTLVASDCSLGSPNAGSGSWSARSPPAGIATLLRGRA